MSKYDKNYLIKILKKIFKNKKNIFAYSLMIIFILFFVFISYKYYQYFDLLKDPRNLKKIVLSYRENSVLIFLIIQVIQVVVFFIPGEIVQVAGGYIYGTFLGGILSLLGITIGSSISYYFSFYFRKECINNFFRKGKSKFLSKIIPRKNNEYLIFILYLIPGLPKDALAYICGASQVKFKKFILLSTLGRIPCIFISAYFGYKIEIGEMSTTFVIAIVMTILFLIGFFKWDKIIKKISRRKN